MISSKTVSSKTALAAAPRPAYAMGQILPYFTIGEVRVDQHGGRAAWRDGRRRRGGVRDRLRLGTGRAFLRTEDVAVSFSFLQIAGYVVLAGLAALLASVVPARRAASLPVIRGLAFE